MTPSGWSMHRIWELGEVQAGRQRSPNAQGKLRPYLRVANVFDGHIDSSDVFQMPFTDEEYERFKLRPGDILLNEGQSLALVGRCAVYKGDPPDCCYQNTLIRFRPNGGVETRFAQKLLQHCHYTGRFSAIAARTTSIAHLGVDRFSSLTVAIPPRDEQERIADTLESWDRSVDLAENLIVTKQQRRKWLMQQLLTGERRFPGFNDKWQTVHLREIIEPVSRRVPKPPGPYRALGIRSHCKGTFSRLVEEPDTVAMDELYVVRADDLIVNITFAWEGAIAIVPLEHDGYYVSHRFPTFRANPDRVHLDYLRYLVTQRRFIFLLGLISPGGAGRNRVLSKRDFLELRVSLPALEEQEKIARVLRLADTELSHLTDLLAALREQKNGLMQRLLTGRIRLRGRGD